MMGKFLGIPWKNLLGWMAVLLVVLGGAEAGAYVAIEHVAHPRAPFLFYTQPQITDETLADYLQVRDSLLGWPRRDHIGTQQYDRTGARPMPTFPTPGEECISAYGDSFIYGFEVSNAEVWSNLLSQRLECRIANYGVSGFGPGQALLRFRSLTQDSAPVVILGIYHENIVRVVNQHRYLIDGGDPLTFKPRFTGDVRNGLQLIPLPGPHISQVRLALADPHRALTHEWFLPGTTDGPVRVAFPYSLRLMRSFRSSRLRAWLRGEPSWIDFFGSGHPSGALPTLTAIAIAFNELAQERGQTLLVVVFPTARSYRLLQGRGVNVGDPLVSRLRADDITVLDLTHVLPRYLKGQDYCSLLTVPERCAGHYTAKGNRVVAEALGDYLLDLELLHLPTAPSALGPSAGMRDDPPHNSGVP